MGHTGAVKLKAAPFSVHIYALRLATEQKGRSCLDVRGLAVGVLNGKLNEDSDL